MTKAASPSRQAWRVHVLRIAAVLLLSLAVRGGTGVFLAAHLDDPGWFQFGSYKIFHERTENILAGTEPVFFVSDPARTDLIQYPPGFPLYIGAIYRLTGEHSAYGVLRVQWLLDALITPLLILGIATTAFGRKVGYVGGVFAALSPLLAFCAVTPTSDAAASWAVLGALWLLLLAVKRKQWQFAALAGLVLGVGCWLRVNPLFLVVAWAAALVIIKNIAFKTRLALAVPLVFVTMLLVAPVAVRNVVVFDEVVLTGLNVGSNLWEGLGETEFGRSQGFGYGDGVMVESERAELGYPPDFPMTPNWPDGIRRDNERARRSLEVIVAHPLWYSGVMATRMLWMLKIAGDPGEYYGTAGINCTASKCLPEQIRVAPFSWVITLIGWLQSVYRYLAIPLALIGSLFSFKRERAAAGLLFVTVLYYLGPGTFTHTELRYVLPMHGVLVVLSALGVVECIALVASRIRGARQTLA